MATADAALYRAKHMGRNRISLPATEPDIIVGARQQSRPAMSVG